MDQMGVFRSLKRRTEDCAAVEPELMATMQLVSDSWETVRWLEGLAVPMPTSPLPLTVTRTSPLRLSFHLSESVPSTYVKPETAPFWA